MNTLKIYLNENLSWKVSKALREYGYDVLSSYEADMNATDDATQFDLAVSEGRTLVTNNFADFVELYQEYASAGKEHYGIIFTTKCSNSMLIKRLKNLLATLKPEDVKNQIIWLNEFD